MPKIENTKYERWYVNLIKVARKEQSLEPHIPNTEKHHILPRCLGGTDDENNLVRFSIRQHYIAHMLLIRMYEGREKYQLEWALFRLSGKPSNRIILTSRQFEKSRSTLHSSLKGRKQSPEHIAKRVAQTTGEGNGMHKKNGRTPTQLGKPHTEETKEKIRLAQLERFADPDYVNPNIGRVMLDETKEKISNSKKGKKMPKEFGDQVSKRQIGTTKTEDTKMKMRKNAALSCEWDIITPEGEHIHIKGLSEFCRERKLGYQSMCLAAKYNGSFKGYIIRKSIS
jgi:hypothetical protein